MTVGLEIDGLEGRLGPFLVGPVSGRVGPGEVLVVAGPSGAGKSTLLRLLAGLLRHGSGSLRLEGRDLGTLPAEERGIGYVPQSLALFPHRTALGNVRYPLEVRERTDAKARAEELLARFGISHRASAFPRDLSGGERQRVAIARAIASEPRALLLDEPISALDLEAREEVLELLRAVVESERLPMVLVTHDAMTGFPLGDRFLFLEGGRMSQIGRPADLVAAPASPFVARFVGFENVITNGELASQRTGPFHELLRRCAGTGGVAFPTACAEVSEPPHGWPARVLRWRVSPTGFRLSVELEGLRLEVEVPDPEHRSPPTGREVRLVLREERLCPVGGTDARASHA